MRRTHLEVTRCSAVGTAGTLSLLVNVSARERRRNLGAACMSQCGASGAKNNTTSRRLRHTLLPVARPPHAACVGPTATSPAPSNSMDGCERELLNQAVSSAPAARSWLHFRLHAQLWDAATNGRTALLRCLVAADADVNWANPTEVRRAACTLQGSLTSSAAARRRGAQRRSARLRTTATRPRAGSWSA
jgi:hypothetical protein